MFRAVKDIRYYLNSVMLETGPKGAYIVATDGHTLAVSRVDADTNPLPDAQFILPDTITAELAKIKKLSIIVELPEQAGKYDGKTKRTLRIKTLASTNAPITTLECEEVDATFPDWRRVTKHTFDPQAPAVSYDPQYLARVDDAARIIRGTKKGNVATVVRPGADGTLGFAWLDYVGDVCAWVGPRRDDMNELPNSPAWTI
jgi:hypothetical protein